MNPLSAIVVAIFILIVIFIPFAAIWALNVLFGLAIPCTFETWIAVVVLVAVFQPVTLFTK